MAIFRNEKKTVFMKMAYIDFFFFLVFCYKITSVASGNVSLSLVIKICSGLMNDLKMINSKTALSCLPDTVPWSTQGF